MPYASDQDLTDRIDGALEVDPALRSIALTDASKRIDDQVFGGQSVQAHCYLAAHLLALRHGVLGGESPTVTSLKAGEIAATFASPAGSTGGDSDLGRTKWGREFRTISDSLCTIPIMV